MDRQFQFYIVPTPIGNLKDITLRALEVLKSVDIIACEDSRNTQKLLNHFDIKTKCISYHKYNEKERVAMILDLLNSGKKIALVSDAGTPMICDPGSVLLKELRKHNIEITALPGACAITSFLSQVAREGEDFAFVGFLPKTDNALKKVLLDYKIFNMVFYESPNRLIKTLNTVQEVRPNTKVAVGRELTKFYEELIIDSAKNLIKHFDENELKGEIVAMIYKDEQSNFEDMNLDKKISDLSSKGFKSKEIATILSTLYDLNKNEVYKKLI